MGERYSSRKIHETEWRACGVNFNSLPVELEGSRRE